MRKKGKAFKALSKIFDLIEEKENGFSSFYRMQSNKKIYCDNAEINDSGTILVWTEEHIFRVARIGEQTKFICAFPGFDDNWGYYLGAKFYDDCVLIFHRAKFDFRVVRIGLPTRDILYDVKEISLRSWFKLEENVIYYNEITGDNNPAGRIVYRINVPDFQILDPIKMWELHKLGIELDDDILRGDIQ